MSATDRFDQAAGTWDQEDRRVVLAHAVAEAIQGRTPLTRSQAVLDFGCGTGLVTLALAPLAANITGADTSTGMLATLQEKSAAQGLAVAPLRLEPAGTGSLGGPYDLIVSSMTLHHVEDVPALFRRFGAHLRPGGRVALADLDAEDGSFHEDATGVHHQGFSREAIGAWLKAAGFQDIRVETATVTRKAGKDYPVFLAVAKKGE